MKYSKEYYDAMWVLENTTKYDDRDVVRAQTYVNTYLEGFRDGQGVSNVKEISKAYLLTIFDQYEISFRDGDGHWFKGVENDDYEFVVDKILSLLSV